MKNCNNLQLQSKEKNYITPTDILNSLNYKLEFTENRWDRWSRQNWNRFNRFDRYPHR